MNPRTLIDLERYPIENLDAPAGRSLVSDCRRQLDERALCLLPGFLRAGALGRLAVEAQVLAPQAYRTDNPRTPYGWMHNKGFPPDHPRSALFRNACGSVMTHQIAGDSEIQRLYHWDPLTEFVRAALGLEALYRSACPHLSLVINVMTEDDRLGWHFDTNDGVVSLLLQQPDEGGRFEYAPYIRSEEDENDAALARLFRGEAGIAVQPAITPGTFVLFKGRRSCHRVTRLGPTTKPRLIALFSYDERPGMVFPELTVRDLMNPSPEPYCGQPE